MIANPDITIYEISSKTDFLYIGCDGIFDVFQTSKLNQKFWNIIKKHSYKEAFLVRELVDSSLEMTMKK